jgi:CIC family chloride channel protein
VAVSIGVRRLLSKENIYTVKLIARRHFIAKALQANMFLVRQAGEVMDKDLLVLRDDMSVDVFLRLPNHGGRMRHVVITKGSEILGVLRVNTALRHGLEGAYTSLTLGEVAIRHFTTAGG